jgi:hypothetical protein
VSAEPRVRQEPRRAIPWLLAAAWLLAGMACDDRSMSEPAARLCHEVAAQCQLAEGPLGVCERARCDAGEAPPCFQCVPQH